MITVGVTGGIGSGKSTVCKEWEKLGAKVVYADDLAKELMVNDPELRKKLIDTFGAGTYHSDGSLNRSHLIHQAFEENRVEKLNQIVHPAVTKKFRTISKEAEKEGEKMVVEEAALLLNKGRPPGLDVVVIVISDRKKRLKRVVDRDGVHLEKVMARDEKQPNFEKILHLADYVIDNNGTIDNLKKKARALYSKLIERDNP